MQLAPASCFSVTLPVLENRQVLRDTFLLSFEHASLTRLVRPGQFVMVSFPEAGDPVLPRPFAFFNVEGARFQVLYRRVGKGTGMLSAVRPGGTLRVLGPLGNGFALSGGRSRALVIAGGIGIASVNLLMGELLAGKRDTMLFYGGRNRDDLLSLSHLEEAGLKVKRATDQGDLGFHGSVYHLFERFLENHPGPPSSQGEAFLCGPLPMLRRFGGLLAEKGIKGQFSMETQMACGYGVCQGCVLPVRGAAEAGEGGYRKVCSNGPVFAGEEIDWDRF